MNQDLKFLTQRIKRVGQIIEKKVEKENHFNVFNTEISMRGTEIQHLADRLEKLIEQIDERV